MKFVPSLLVHFDNWANRQQQVIDREKERAINGCAQECALNSRRIPVTSRALVGIL